VKAARAAVEGLKLVNAGGERMLLPEFEDAFRKFKPPTRPQYALVGNIDNMPVMETGQPKEFAQSHRIFDRGQLVGRWEFDTVAESIAWVSLVPLDRAREAAVRNAVLNMEAFIRADLGDARGFSLDSPQSRAPRVEAIRNAASLQREMA
jgi:hypothetical protein